MPAYWVIPLVAAATWLGERLLRGMLSRRCRLQHAGINTVTLLTMLIYWISKGQPRYRSMDRKQDIAFVSDVVRLLART